MSTATHTKSPEQDLRSLLKTQHKRVYSICRFFANNYTEHQRLFASIISAASQSIRCRRGGESKQVLLLRACINMAALHSISLELQPAVDRSIRFKSPDYQRNMVVFRQQIDSASDYDKMRMFLQIENAGDIADLTGPMPSRTQASSERVKKSFIPYLKERLIWS